MSWLNLRGKPQVALVHFTIPCESPNIVESKSFKLYLNSFQRVRGPVEHPTAARDAGARPEHGRRHARVSVQL